MFLWFALHTTLSEADTLHYCILVEHTQQAPAQDSDSSWPSSLQALSVNSVYFITFLMLLTRLASQTWPLLQERLWFIRKCRLLPWDPGCHWALPGCLLCIERTGLFWMLLDKYYLDSAALKGSHSIHSSPHFLFPSPCYSTFKTMYLETPI